MCSLSLVSAEAPFSASIICSMPKPCKTRLIWFRASLLSSTNKTRTWRTSNKFKSNSSVLIRSNDAFNARERFSVLNGLGSIAATPACLNSSSFSGRFSDETNINGIEQCSGEFLIDFNMSTPVPSSRYIELTTKSAPSLLMASMASLTLLTALTFSTFSLCSNVLIIFRWVSDGSTKIIPKSANNIFCMVNLCWGII